MKRSAVALLHFALIALASAALFPLVWLVASSIDRATPARHYIATFHRPGFTTWFVNSIFIASATTVLTILVSSLGGFALAKYRFRGRRVVMGLMLATMLLPAHLLLPGMFDLVARLGLADTYAAVIVPGALSLFATLLYARSMRSVSDDELDAARLDGAREWRLWWDVALPSSAPTTAAVLLMTFLGSWNGFIWPQLVLQSESKHTLPIGLANLSALPGQFGDLGLLLASTALAILPAAALFFATQRGFISGLSRTI